MPNDPVRSQLVDLKGLNTVWTKINQDVKEKISKLGDVWNIKGSLTWTEILSLTSAEKGDVYNILDESPVGPAGSNIACVEPFSSEIPAEEWKHYWNQVGGVFDLATLNKPGFVKGAVAIPTTLTGSLGKIFVGDGRSTIGGVKLVEGALYVETSKGISPAGSSSQPIYIDDNYISHGITTISLGASDVETNVASFTAAAGSSTATLQITGRNVTSEDSDLIGAVTINGGLYASGNIKASKVFHAVWNDITDAIEVQDSCEIEPGYCYYFNGKEYYKTDKYCEKGLIGIHSDTSGSVLGRKGKCKELDIAIGGFVLAHTDKIYKVGTPLTCTKEGKLTKACLLSRILHPERIVGIFWKEEKEEEWGSISEKVKVNKRNWIKIK